MAWLVVKVSEATTELLGNTQSFNHVVDVTVSARRENERHFVIISVQDTHKLIVKGRLFVSQNLEREVVP